MAVLIVVAGSTACSSTSATKGLAAGFGRLTGHVGPGVPPNGTVPNLVLTFSNGIRSFQTKVRNGIYTIDLPAGVWSVHSSSGLCAIGISVSARAWQRDDLGYPMAHCQNLAGPSSPMTPPPPNTDLKVTISPTSGPAGTTVHIEATGCIDANGLNHAVSFNWGGLDQNSQMANRNNPNIVVAIPAILSGGTIRATHTVTEQETGFGGGLFFVQCGTALKIAEFTVTK